VGGDEGAAEGKEERSDIDGDPDGVEAVEGVGYSGRGEQCRWLLERFLVGVRSTCREFAGHR